jgi:hypothetical protein
MSSELTPEEIAQHYSAAMDSVNLINQLVDGTYPTLFSDKDKADTIKRNVDHLKIMVAKDFWTNEDLQPFHDAITTGENA